MENTKESDYLEDVGFDGWIISKWILKMWTRDCGLE
jgi:hypothetical protein